MSTYWTIKCRTCNIDMREDGIYWNHAGEGLHEFITRDVPALRVLAQTHPHIVVKVLPDYGYDYGIWIGWFVEHGPTHDVVAFNEYNETFEERQARFK